MANSNSKHFLAEVEESMLKLWAKEKTFERSLGNRKGQTLFNFYDGPPFANGIPHYGHLEQSTIKDSVSRYKTMRGYYVPRKLGWDTHGLPIEYAIEKEHDFKSKKDIVKFGIEKFNKECRDSVFLYRDVWEKMFKRIGRWADFENTYATFDDNYMESVWWVFKSLFDKDLVYKDFRSSPYCPRCATPLSNFELNQGYQDNVKDPSLFIKFKLKNEDAFLLGWTTTPWSLPGNAAIAVNPDADYLYVKLKDDEGKEEVLVLARDRLEALSVESYEIVKEIKGNQLVGLEYEPLFKLNNLSKYENHSNLYKVWVSDTVNINEGSGVLHIAPAFGEDDLMLSKQHSLPVLSTIDENGHVSTDFGIPEAFSGKFFKQADKPIIEYLTKKQMVYAAEEISHTYPFCWRCDTPLLYYATDSWMVRVTAVKERLIANNQKIDWTPSYIRDGRFGNWLEQARDWAISRNRFWGNPLPIWVTGDGEVVVVGSIKELKDLAVNPEEVKDLHRPYIDDVVIKTESGKLARRIPEVFDVWFESGSMPYAQDHYPFDKKEEWEKSFPADFIAEAVDQTRGWFYTLHVLATALFDEPAYQSVICSGWIVAADGQKLSKRKKNYAPMDDVFDQYGVDTLRFFIANSPLMNGEDTRFSVDLLREVQRKVFMTLDNTYNFFELYAKVDGWKPSKDLVEPVSNNILDQWMIARLNEVVEEVTKSMDQYRLDKATRPIAELLDDLSNWYVRRSRRRFWKSQDDDDKKSAYETLHYTLIHTCQLIAPFAPFLADSIWRKLRINTNLPDSVHLSDWPRPGKVDGELIKSMKFAREVVTEGLSQRAKSGIKVRQPLLKVNIQDDVKLTDSAYIQLISEELNVKQVEFKKAAMEDDRQSKVELDTKITPELHLEGLAREVVRLVQNARKQAGLEVDDRIVISLISQDKELSEAINKHIEIIKTETLATNSVAELSNSIYSGKSMVEGKGLLVAINKA